LRFFPFGVGDTAVYGADGGALWFFVKTDTLGTLVGHDVVKLVTDGFLLGIGFDNGTGFDLIGLGDGGAFAHFPFHATFVDGRVGAFWLAGSAVYTVVGDEDGHSFSLFSGDRCGFRASGARNVSFKGNIKKGWWANQSGYVTKFTSNSANGGSG
jgi:hypothetical protein